jgi:hypothetical protein
MAELIIGASYPARRSGAVVVGESKQGALMVYIPFTLTSGIAYSGNHSVCIGTKDGTLQERAIEGLRDIFGWTTENPFDLQRIPLSEGGEPEFILADYHNEPYTPNGKSEQVDSFKFRWLNKLGSGIAPATDEDESAAMAKWGKKFSSAPSTPKTLATKSAKTPVNTAENKPAEKSLPKRALPTKSAKPAEARKETMESVLTLLANKHGANEDDADAMQKLGNDLFFPAQDKLFGANVSAETPEQWGRVADSLGL